MVYKASYHNGVGNPQHNDRTCRQDKMKHVDHTKTNLNVYWHNYMKRPGKLSDYTFRESEKKWYGTAFKDWIDERNDAATRSRHPERRTSAAKLLSNTRTRPEETIIQIGDGFNYPDDPKLLQDCFMDLMKYRYSLVQRHCKMLNFAIHYDETTPHIHERHVWVYHEDNTNTRKIGQEKALEKAGIELPDPSQPVGKNNNRKMTYDKLMRDEWYCILERHGLEIDRVPNPEHRPHYTKEGYIDFVLQSRELAAQQRAEKETNIK